MPPWSSLAGRPPPAVRFTGTEVNDSGAPAAFVAHRCCGAGEVIAG
jgi:hypothetical protein